MNRARNRQSMRRVVYKQGYLKKLPNNSKFGSSVKKPERRWFVFGIIGGSDPYLEYYENEDAIFEGSPINIIFLESIIRVIRAQTTPRYQNVFTLVLRDRHLSLVAPTRENMFEWCRTFESQLKNLGLLEINVDGENDYVDVPGVTERMPSRRHTHATNGSTSEVTVNGIDDNNNGSSPDRRFGASHSGSGGSVYVNVAPKVGSHLLRRNNRPQGLQLRDATQPQPPGPSSPQERTRTDTEGDEYEILWDRNEGDDNDYSVPNRLLRCQNGPVNSVNPSHPEPQSPTSQRDDAQLLPTVAGEPSLFSSPPQREQVIAMDTSRIPEGGQSGSYHRMTSQGSPDASPRLPSHGSVLQASPPISSPLPGPGLTAAQSPTSPYPGVSLVASPFNSSSACSSPTVISNPDNFQQFSVIPEKMRESLSTNNTGAVEGWTAAPPLGGDAPPPYMPKGMLEKGANKSLKISQMEKLQKQQNNAGGLKIVLKRIDCHHCLAFVQCFGAIWIAGWNQTARPFLQTAFHVGDQLISINGQVVESTKVAYKLIKQCNEWDKINLILKRLPKARIFTFRRERPGEDLGIVRDSGTGEIKVVKEGRLASQQGLPAKSQSADGSSLCNWYITEVNHRPVSLFFKDQEIDHRLNAVGLDISILVQPEDLIKEFKKQLKAMKKYKDFLVK